MCGRFTLTVDDFDALLALTGAVVESEAERAELAERYRARYNVAPMQRHWIVSDEGEQRRIARAGWGLVNFWMKSRRQGARQINARAETVHERRAYRQAFEQRRCVIPADGFFEWSGEAKERRPWWFHRPDNAVYCFAGLYEVARLDGEEESSTTFTILTTQANPTVEPIHDRMPVILPDDAAIDEWLYARQEPERLRELLRPVDDRFLVRTPVSTRVNSVKNDDPACLDEAEGETQGSLM